MAHVLSQDRRSRFRDAFDHWDISGDGSIRARDLCKVMELLGEAPSPEIRALFDGPDAEDERVSFDEFLTITVGPPWETFRPDPEEELNKAIAAFDDGNGYVPLRDLIRIVLEHMEDSDHRFTGGDLLDLYREAFDGSLFPTAGGRLAPESTWKIFEKEFAEFSRGRMTENVDSATSGRKCCDLLGRLQFAHLGPVSCFRRLWSQLGWQSVDSDGVRHRAGDNGQSTGEAANMINLTVVDLGGKRLMTDVVASTWSVQALQQHIETVVGVPVHRQFLFLAGNDGLRHELCSTDACLCKAGVLDGSTLLLVVNAEVKLDYKKFLSRFLEVEFEHAMARAQNYGRGV